MYSQTDSLLDRNFHAIDQFPSRPDGPLPEGDRDELDDERWNDIPEDSLKPLDGSSELDDQDELTSRHSLPLAPLRPDEQSRIDRAIREVGFEAIAFYKSKRFITRKPFPGVWGIFYLRAGVEYLATRMAQDYRISNPLPLAYELLRRHERYHFKADMYTMMLELVQRQQLYVPVRRAFRGRSTQFVEEALANRDVWTFVRDKEKPLKDFARDWMTVQPGAYQRFDEWKDNLTAEWAANTLDGNYSRNARRDDVGAWTVSVPSVFIRPSVCPEWTIDHAISSSLFPAVLRMPTVIRVDESEAVKKLLAKKYRHLEGTWDDQKSKLYRNPGTHGLDFYPWEKPDLWSVRVTKGFRAHLRSQTGTPGHWLTEEFGPHDELGHG